MGAALRPDRLKIQAKIVGSASNKDFGWNLIFVFELAGRVGVVWLFVPHRKDLYL